VSSALSPFFLVALILTRIVGLKYITVILQALRDLQSLEMSAGSTSPLTPPNGKGNPSPLVFFQTILANMKNKPEVCYSKFLIFLLFPQLLSPKPILAVLTYVPENTFQLTLLQVDWDIVAKKTGYNSAGTARTRYGQIMRKMGSNESGDGSMPSPAKSKAGKRPSKVGSGTNTSPSKISKSNSGSRGKTTNLNSSRSLGTKHGVKDERPTSISVDSHVNNKNEWGPAKTVWSDEDEDYED